MKKIFRTLSIIVFAAVVFFSLTGCPELLNPGNENDDNNTENNNTDNTKKPDNDSGTGPDTKTGNDVITNVNDIAAHLNEQTGTKEEPAILSVKIDIGTMSNANSGWQRMLNAIDEAGKYVALDLSTCIVSDDFDNASDIKTGKDKIVSLILPNGLIEGITNGSSSSNGVFQHYTNLKSVTGKNLKVIGKYAFAGCDSLTTVFFPNAHNVGDYAFSGCTGLTSVNFPKAETINPSAFRDCANLAEVSFPKAQIIGDLAFSESGLEMVSFPEVITINPSAFRDCTDLIEVEFPKTQVIGNSAFSGSSLKSVSFPNVITIGQSAFSNCSSLIEVTFLAATLIGDEAFRNCTSLKIARFHANPTRKTDNPNYGKHPLQPRLDGGPGIFDTDCVVFNPDALRGCTSLETLDVSNAWNIYFARGVLADIGTYLELLLFDDDGTDVGGKSYGHPQIEPFLGVGVNEDIALCGSVTLKSIKIFAPTVTPGASQIEKSYVQQTGDTPEFVAIHTGIKHIMNGRVPNVTVIRVSSLYP